MIAAAPLRHPVFWILALVVPLLILGVYMERGDLDKIVFAPLYGLRGERTVGAILRTLGPEYRVVHDLDIGRGNVDHVVIGPTGVFAVETKAWRETVWLDEGSKLMSGRWDRSRAIGQALAEAIAVRERIGDVRWVEAVIALSRLPLPSRMDIRGVSVLDARDVPSFIQDRTSKLSPDEVERAFAQLTRPRDVKVRTKR